MITVNNPGSWRYIYPPLEHSKWNGCTPTDLVFPFFLFVVGVSMFFSFSKYNNTLNRDSLLRIGKRTLLIFLIGLFLNSFPQWLTNYSTLRILGVLQRIALAYGIGAIIVLSVKPKLLPYICGGILLAYWGLIWFLGGPDPYSLQGNITSVFDSAILGTAHMYTGFGIPFDPEGFFSTIPAIGTVIIGYQTGKLIRSTNRDVLPLKLLSWGVAAVIAGYAWGQLFPINKPIWSSSYVLYSAGWAMLVLSLFIWLIDIKEWKGWTKPFVVFGMNPLFLFAFAGIWAKTLTRIKIGADPQYATSLYNWIYETIFAPIGGNTFGSLLFALTHIVIFWFIGYILYKKNIFIKV
ncbi:MAG: hypothetical protein Q8862_13030 [Bacteroidota bacterium]|nr:hypothetical protein [Bacteroidota bacterium]